jgi:hypothetical protein
MYVVIVTTSDRVDARALKAKDSAFKAVASRTFHLRSQLYVIIMAADC